MEGVRGELDQIGERVRGRFDAQRRVLSFSEYLELVLAHPYRHTRDAARYLRGCLDHYGSYEVTRPWGVERRYRVFDLAFGGAPGGPPEARATDSERRERLIGHEAIQAHFYRALDGFVREGRANRLLLLHGPNGSAKSTFAACVMRALEAYSQTDEGALYRFSWVFARRRDAGGIGFGSERDALPRGGSYAHLDEDRLEVKLRSELREHPLLLLPRPERQRFVRDAYTHAGVAEGPPESIAEDDLSHKNRLIFDALLTAYRGDLDRVFAHVQVERFYVSRRYRVGAVTIGPQMAVDAGERQITADLSLNALPASLSALTLFEPFGELVDAAGGVIEYSDLLKRPLDAWRYLLLAIESGEVALTHSNLAVNAVMVASSNDLHLKAFKEHPEYNSFRGRLVLVRMPYLVSYAAEQEIYDTQIVPHIHRHVGPHATFVAALWAVLTRLRRAQLERYDDPKVGSLAAALTPYEKARLYAEGRLPRALSADDAKALRGHIRDVYDEQRRGPVYEGLSGASPREIRMILLDAAADEQAECVSAAAVLDRLAAFCERDDYAFLRQDVDHGYYDHAGFVEVARDAWLDRVEAELRRSSGLVDEAQHLALFDRYVMHVSQWVKKERIRNPVTGEYEDPDEQLLRSVEQKLGVSDAEAERFRGDLLGAVAGWALDHPERDESAVDYEALFPRKLQRLEQAYYDEQRTRMAELTADMLATLDEESPAPPDEARRTQASHTVATMVDRHGYQPSSLKIALGELARRRYEE